MWLIATFVWDDTGVWSDIDFWLEFQVSNLKTGKARGFPHKHQ